MKIPSSLLANNNFTLPALDQMMEPHLQPQQPEKADEAALRDRFIPGDVGAIEDNYNKLAANGQETPSRGETSGLGLLMGRISLEMSYRREEVQMSGGNISGFVHEEYLRLDFTFLKGVVGNQASTVKEDAKSLLQSNAFSDFVVAASRLDFFDDSTLTEYNQTVNALFTELEKTLGLGETDLDHAREIFKDQVAEFFDRVQQEGFRNDTEKELPAVSLERPSYGLSKHLMKEMGRLMHAGGDLPAAKYLYEQAQQPALLDRELSMLLQIVEKMLQQNDDLTKENPSKNGLNGLVFQEPLEQVA